MPPYNNESPASKILAYLRRNGEGSVKELEKLLEISTTAVREHLTSLQAKDLLATKLVRRGPGRPHLAYFLTPKAQDLFPKEYDTLINLLLQEITSQEGADRLQVILDAVGARLADEYGGQVAGLEPAERLARLRDVLEARGIPAEVQPDWRLRDGAPHDRADPRRIDRAGGHDPRGPAQLPFHAGQQIMSIFGRT
jgi:predicted ArsR family transcriptional regulator